MTVNLTESPKLSDIPHMFQRAHHNENLVTLSAESTVSKTGRITGSAARGDRLIICKPDGSINVQQPTRARGIARQPIGSKIEFITREDNLELYSRNKSGKEVLTVQMFHVYYFSSFCASNRAPFDRVNTEEQMHEAILEDPSLIETDLRILEHEKRVDNGRMDFFARDKDGQTVIIEAKRETVRPEHCDQLHRYVLHYKRRKNADVRGLLVAPEITRRGRRSVERYGFEFVKVPSFSTRERHYSETTFSDFR